MILDCADGAVEEISDFAACQAALGECANAEFGLRQLRMLAHQSAEEVGVSVVYEMFPYLHRSSKKNDAKLQGGAKKPLRGSVLGF